MNQKGGKPMDAYFEEERVRTDFNSYKAAEGMRPGDVFDPKTNKRNQKIESRWIDTDQIIIYSVVGVVVVGIILLFIFL